LNNDMFRIIKNIYSFLHSNSLYFLAVFIFTFFYSCLERIELEGDPPNPDSIFIFGSLRADESDQQIVIERVRPFDTNKKIPVSNAVVSLFKNGNKIGEYSTRPDEPGIYRLQNFEADTMTDNHYHVEVLLGEKTYRSAPESVPELIPIDSSSHEYISREAISIYAHTAIDRTKPRWMRWTVDELVISPENTDCGPPITFICYYTPDILLEDIVLWETNGNTADRLDFFLVHTEPIRDRFEYHSRHYFNVYQFAISESAYTYWQTLRSVITLEGTVFDKPPASVRGNFININDTSELVLGYFEVTRVDTARSFTFPSEHIRETRAFNIPCLNNFQSPMDDRCCDCRSIPGATTEAPYWLEI